MSLMVARYGYVEGDWSHYGRYPACGATQLQVLVTSRPDTPIRLGFRDTSGIWHRDLVLNEVPREIVDCDICGDQAAWKFRHSDTLIIALEV